MFTFTKSNDYKHLKLSIMKDSKGNSIKKGDVVKFNCFGNRTETIVKVKKEILMGCKMETVFIKLANGSLLEVGANEVTLIKK